jgi:hypothetical protein
MKTREVLRKVAGKIRSPRAVFHSDHYLRHNQRRQEHLATLGVDLSNQSVLEIGAGIGDHTSFFLDRNCRVLVTEGRPDNVALLREKFSAQSKTEVRTIDVDQPVIAGLADNERFDIVYCYGLLYHLKRPEEALRFMAAHCSGLLLLELCVSFGDNVAVNLVAEDQIDPSQAWTGTGCRPTRPWVFSTLKGMFEHVYVPRTQPWHEEFPVDWSAAAAAAWTPGRLSRSVFVASRRPLNSPLLLSELPATQTR